MPRTVAPIEVIIHACFKLDRRWCYSDGRQGGMGHPCLSVSPPEIYAYRGIGSRTRDDGKGGLINEYAHLVETQNLLCAFRGNTKYLIKICWGAPTS